MGFRGLARTGRGKKSLTMDRKGKDAKVVGRGVLSFEKGKIRRFQRIRKIFAICQKEKRRRGNINCLCYTIYKKGSNTGVLV